MPRISTITPITANTEKGLLDHYAMVAKRLRSAPPTRAPAIHDEVHAKLPAITIARSKATSRSLSAPATNVTAALADGVIKAERLTGLLATLSMADGASDATKIHTVLDAMQKLPCGVSPIRHVMRVVSTVFSISMENLKSARRTADVVRPRQIGMAIAYRLKLGSMPAIGRAFGGRDHTTVLHSVRKLGHLIDEAMINFPGLQVRTL